LVYNLFMDLEAKIIHSVERDKNRHWHVMLLLIPSIVFVCVLAFFMRDKFSSTKVTATSVTVVPTAQIQVGSNNVAVKLAKSIEEQRQGLSGVSVLGENDGMLFVFQSKSQTPFWMKDMLIPLDMIWITDGKVVQVDADIPFPPAGIPESGLKLYIPDSPANYVLEVNAGWAKSHNVKVGDSVTIP